MNKNLLSSLKGPWLRKGIAVLVFGMAVFNIAVTIKPSSSDNSFPNLSLSSISANATARDGDTDPPGGGGGGNSGLLWEGKDINCEITVTVTYGGGPWPGSYTVQEKYPGVKHVCVDGWTFCWGGDCQP